MTSPENHPKSPDNEEVDYAGILNKTLEHSFVRSKPGTTLANLGNLQANNQQDTPEETTATSTVQEDTNLLNLEADLKEKSRQARIEMKKTGKHINRQG